MDVKKSVKRFAYVTHVTMKMLGFSALLLVYLLAKFPPWQWLSDLRPLGVNPDNFCLFDRLQYVLQSENIVIHYRTGLGYTLQLLSSMMIDASFLNSCVTWISCCATGRLYWALLMFYFTRSLIQVRIADSGSLPI